MNTTTATLKVLGQVAGIGGLALGVLLLIFREVVRKNIFPNLAQAQAYRLIRLLVTFTFITAIAGIAAWVFIQRQQGQVPIAAFPTATPQPVIDRYLAKVDEGKYDDAYSQMSLVAKKRIEIGLLRSSYESVRVPLGTVVARKVIGQTPFERGVDGATGPFLSVVLRTRFEKGTYAELMTMQAEDDAWKVAGHFIVPCQPPTCEPEKE